MARLKAWIVSIPSRIREWRHSRRDAKIWGSSLYRNDWQWPLGSSDITPAHHRVMLTDWLLGGKHRPRLLARAIYRLIGKLFRERELTAYAKGLKTNRGRAISKRERQALLELRDALKKYL